MYNSKHTIQEHLSEIMYIELLRYKTVHNYTLAFNLLSECHSFYSSKEIEEDNLQKVDKQNNVNTNINTNISVTISFLFNRNLTSKLHDLLS